MHCPRLLIPLTLDHRFGSYVYHQLAVSTAVDWSQAARVRNKAATDVNANENKMAPLSSQDSSKLNPTNGSQHDVRSDTHLQCSHSLPVLYRLTAR
jgi:hypothetical protein